MKKNRSRFYICLLIIFVVFSFVAFAAPFARTRIFWIAYLFVFLAAALQIYIFHMSFAGGSDAKSRFYGFPIAKIGAVYLAAQLAVSLIEMAAAVIAPVWAAVIINVILLAAALVGCIAGNAMKEEIVRQDTQLKGNVSNMRALQSLSSALVGQCSDPDLKETLRQMAECFRFSDPISSEGTKELEEDLQKQLDEIQRAVIDKDTGVVKELCARILSVLNERNRICMLNK